MATIDYGSLIKNMPVAYALHEMIYDENDRAVDYRFIDVNNEFEVLTGLSLSVVSGKTCLELLPETEHYWIDKYDECIKTGKAIHYDNYSKELKRYFQVTAYSPAPGMFVLMFLDVSERISEYEKSDKVASFFKSITENATDAIVILDKDIKYSYVSPSAFKLTGYQIYDVDKIDPAELTHPDDLVYLLPELQRLLAEPTYKPTISYRFKIKSGKWLWIESTFSNLYDHPEVQGIVINFRDISEQKDYLEKLKLNEQRYRLTQEVGNIGSWEYCTLKKRYWNSPQLRKLFGIDSALDNADKINENIISSIIGYDRVENTLHELINLQKPYEIEFEIIRPNDGLKRLLYSRAELVADSDCNNTLVRGVIMDITEQRANEQRLKQSEALLAATLRHSRFSIWSVDTNKNLIYANDTFLLDFQKSFGVKLELGKSIIDVLPDVLKPVWLDRYKRTFENNSFVEEDEIFIGDDRIYIEVSATPIYVDDKIVGASFYGENITTRKKTELKIKRSEEKYQNLYNLHRLMADTMPDMLWAKNQNKEFLFVNKSMCDNLLGAIDTNEPIGKTDMFFAQRERLKHPERNDWHTFGELCEESDDIILEELKHKQFYEQGNIKGEYMYLNVHKAPLFNYKGELIGIVGTARDETTKKRIEDALVQNTENINKTLKMSTKFILPKLENADYENITQLLRDISGAKYIIFNWFDGQYSYTKSISGVDNLNNFMHKYLGIDVFSKKWKRQPELDEILINNKFSVLKDISKLLSYDFNETIVKVISRLLGSGEVVLVALKGNNRIVGSLFLVYEHKANIQNSELIELFSYQLGQFIERTNAENALKQKMEEMERFHKLTINRELNMIELKKEVNLLLAEQGKELKYKIVT